MPSCEFTKVRVGVVTNGKDCAGPTKPVELVGTMMAVGTGVVAVPLPTPMALIPIGTLDSPGAWGCEGVFTLLVAPVPVVAGGGEDVLCPKTNVLASARPAVIKVVRKPILGPL